MPSIRMLCKECDEDMLEASSENASMTMQYIEYVCPTCGKRVGLELDELEDGREGAVLEGAYDWQ